MAKFVKNAIFGNNYNGAKLGCSEFPDTINIMDLPNARYRPFSSEINTLKCEGVVSGYPDGLFHPERNVTRGEATKFVINSLRKKYKDEGVFEKYI